MRRAVVLASLALALASSTADVARAETPPSRWDIARDPGVRERWELHVRVQQLLMLRLQLDTESMRDATLGRARAMLEEANAATSPDVRLRFDLGEVLYMLDRNERAVVVLASALEMAPNHPIAPTALEVMANAYAKLDRPREERAAYERYLALVTDDRMRAGALLNLAEAEMRLGNMRESLADYREGIAISEQLPSSPGQARTLVLLVWGLAIALDRDAQPRDAIGQARRAVMMDPDDTAIAHDPNVFFVPSYERNWYLALGATARAEDEKQPAEAAKLWAKVETYWKKYIDPADANDRWLALARVRRDRAKAQRAAAEARVPPAQPAPRPPAKK